MASTNPWLNGVTLPGANIGEVGYLYLKLPEAEVYEKKTPTNWGRIGFLKGDKGDDGRSNRFLGNFNIERAYSADSMYIDIVYYSGSCFYCVKNCTGQTPLIKDSSYVPPICVTPTFPEIDSTPLILNSEYWNYLVKQGDKGDVGPMASTNFSSVDSREIINSIRR